MYKMIEIALYAIWIFYVSYFAWQVYINPYYLCKIRKFKTEMDKAVECSKVFWFKIDRGAQTRYEYLLKYDLIIEEELMYLVSYMEKEQIDDNGLLKDKDFEELEAVEKINVLYSIFLLNLEIDPYETYFAQYQFKDLKFKREIMCKVKLLKVYDEVKLKTMGFLQYKFTKEKIFREILDTFENAIIPNDQTKYKAFCLESNYIDCFDEIKIDLLHKIFISKYPEDIYNDYFKQHKIISKWKTEDVDENLKTLTELTDEDIKSLGLEAYL